MNIQNKIQNWNEVLLQADMKIKEVVDQATGQFYFEVAEYKNDNSMACKAINYIKEKTGKDLRFSFLNIDKVIFTTKHEANLEDFIKDYRFDINTENFAYTKVTVKEFDAIKRSNALDKIMARELPINLNSLNHVHTPLHGLNIDLSDKTVVEQVKVEFQKNLNEELKRRGIDYRTQGLATKKEASQNESFNSMLEQLNTGAPSSWHKEMVEDFVNGKSGAVRALYISRTDKNEDQSNNVEKSKPEPKVELDDFAKELVTEFSKPEHKNTVKIVKSKDLGRGR